MLFIWNQQSLLIKKDGLRFFEGIVMLAHVSGPFTGVPFESKRLHRNSVIIQSLSSKIVFPRLSDF
jgi:hypothetical protein